MFFTAHPQVVHEPEAPPEAPSVPTGWDAHWDTEEHKYYYHNSATNETTWEKPSGSQVESKPKAKTNAEMREPAVMLEPEPVAEPEINDELRQLQVSENCY